jgi:predicted alpha/beta hydrolase
MNSLTIAATGGAQIALRVYEPGNQERGSVVIGGAMGVRQDFYAPFAKWLASQGWRVTTFDYRGSGDSLPDTPHGTLRGYRADLFDWTRDYEAAIDHAHGALPGKPLYLLGHSLGAQLPGLITNQHKVSGLLSVAAAAATGARTRRSSSASCRISGSSWCRWPRACVVTFPARSSRRWATCPPA